MRSKGFSLIELMIVIAIIGIITAIAVPSYNSYVQDTYKAQASADMKLCALQLERHYSNGFSYVGFDTGGGASNCVTTNLDHGGSWHTHSPLGANDNVQYVISYVLSATDFTLTATPEGGSCGSGDCMILVRDGTMSEN